jgi:hypothetical protein
MEIENNPPAGLIFYWAGGVPDLGEARQAYDRFRQGRLAMDPAGRPQRTIAELAVPDYVKL